MGFLRKIFSPAQQPTGLDGYGSDRGSSSNVARSKTRSSSRSQKPQRPQGLHAGSESEDSGVVIIRKDSNLTLAKLPEYECPKCAANASQSNAVSTRPSMERMKSFSSTRQQHSYDQHRHIESGHDHSRPGTDFSNHSDVPPMQGHHHRHHHDSNFSSRPLSWGRRATTENVAQDGPGGYTRPVTPPYSIRSEQTGWNSGQQYNDMYGHAPGHASQDDDFSQRPLSWRRATSSHLNLNQDQRQPRSFSSTTQTSRTPSESGAGHPRNQSRNMENSAYEAGYKDAIARLRADAERW